MSKKWLAQTAHNAQYTMRIKLKNKHNIFKWKVPKPQTKPGLVLGAAKKTITQNKKKT